MSSGTRLAVVVLTVAYAVLALVAVEDDRFLHDEGLLTHLLASLVGREPLGTLFLQKARPPLALLYAPIAGAGLGVFLWVHVMVCALAVPLTAGAAHRLGHARPEVAAAVVALSPMFIAAGAAGLMNADAVVGVALVAWLWSGRRMLGAGAVMGALVWVRAELAVLALTMAAVALLRRQPRTIAGLAAFPLVYGLAGAIYHHDLLWMLHWPPALAEPMADNPFWQAHHAHASLPTVVAALLAITPTLALLGLWRWRDASEVERAGLGFAVVFVGALTVLPQWQVFNFDLSPRYLLPILPFVALAVSRIVGALGPEPSTPGGARRVLGLLPFVALALAVERLGGGPWALLAGLVAAFAVAVGGAGWSRASRVLVGLCIATGPVGFTDGAKIAREQQAPALREMVARIAEHPEWSTVPVLTNEPLLAAYLPRVGGGSHRDIRYLVQADQLHELTALSNPDNGQRPALLAALRLGFYGTPVFPEELSPDRVPKDAVFVLRDDPRLSLIMPDEQWAGVIEIVHPGRGMNIGVLAPPAR